MRKKIKDINKALPIGGLFGSLGYIFVVCATIYYLIANFCSDSSVRTILYVVDGVIAFLSVFITFIVIAAKTHKKSTQEELVFSAKECAVCAESKIQDGFHHSGLLTLEELINKYESPLADDPHPEKCSVLVYTSELATEQEAEDAVTNNISKGVQYRVLYFKNSCDEGSKAYRDLKDRYKGNLIKLENDGYFDGDLADTLGFDIMIYCTSDGKKRGFFAVDFLDPISKDNDRKCHSPNCKEMCNYGKARKEEPYTEFYKEMSSVMASELYNGIMQFFERHVDETTD